MNEVKQKLKLKQKAERLNDYCTEHNCYNCIFYEQCSDGDQCWSVGEENNTINSDYKKLKKENYNVNDNFVLKEKENDTILELSPNYGDYNIGGIKLICVCVGNKDRCIAIGLTKKQLKKLKKHINKILDYMETE